MYPKEERRRLYLEIKARQDAGDPVRAVCQELGVNYQTFHTWRERFANPPEKLEEGNQPTEEKVRKTHYPREVKAQVIRQIDAAIARWHNARIALDEVNSTMEGRPLHDSMIYRWRQDPKVAELLEQKDAITPTKRPNKSLKTKPMPLPEELDPNTNGETPFVMIIGKSGQVASVTEALSNIFRRH